MGLFDEIRGSAGGMLARLGEQLAGGRDVSPELMQKALSQTGLAEPTDNQPRAMFHDPYSVVDWGGWRERPSTLTYETLRVMAQRNTVITAIVQLRTWQVAQFAVPQQGRYDKGFRIILRDRRDKKKTMTPAQQKEANELEKMLTTTGFLLPGEDTAGRDNFRKFLKKSVRDILIYDQWCFEKIRDRRGKVSRFVCLPAETIRPAVLDVEHMDPIEAKSRVSHVQVYEDSVIAEFAPEDIAWCIMNPRSDLRVNTFGLSPIEQLVNLVTAWLFGFEYNQRFFSQGSAVKGVLNIKGAIPDRQLRAFRRMWYAQVAGVTNAWRTPILNSDDIQWINMHSTNREMEFAAWMDWLTKLTCAVYGVDPVEINFQYGNTGQSSTLNTPDNEKKVVESKDKGLIPLMDHIADEINQHIIWDLNPDFAIDFTGLSAKSEDQEREARIKEVGNFRTVDEVRADFGDDPLPDDLGKLIMNPTFLQWASQKQMEKQQADQMGGAGGGDEFPLDGDHEDEDEFPMDGDEEELHPAPGAAPGGPPKPPAAPGGKNPNATPYKPEEGGEESEDEGSDEEGDEDTESAPKPPKPPKPPGLRKGLRAKRAEEEVDALIKSMQVTRKRSGRREVTEIKIPGGIR